MINRAYDMMNNINTLVNKNDGEGDELQHDEEMEVRHFVSNFALFLVNEQTWKLISLWKEFEWT